LQVGRPDWSLILLGLAVYLLSASTFSVFLYDVKPYYIYLPTIRSITEYGRVYWLLFFLCPATDISADSGTDRREILHDDTYRFRTGLFPFGGSGTSPDRLWTSNCSLLLIYLLRKDEKLSQPGWLTYSGRFYPHKWSPIGCRSSVGQGKFAGQRPTFYHCTTQPTVKSSPK